MQQGKWKNETVKPKETIKKEMCMEKHTSLQRPVRPSRTSSVTLASMSCPQREQSIHQLDDDVCITTLVLLGPGRFEGDGGFAVESPCRGACDCVPT